MDNKLIKRKYNNLLTGRNHYFRFGDFLFKPDKNGQVTNRGLGNMSDLGKGIMSAAGAAVGQVGGNLIGNSFQSGAGNMLQSLSGVASSVPGVGPFLSAGLGVFGGLANRAFGAKMNNENIAKVEANINDLNSFQSNASDYDSLVQSWASAPIGMTFTDSYIGKNGWFNHKASDKADSLRNQIASGTGWVQSTLNNNAENIDAMQMQNLLANYGSQAAYGGSLFADGGSIHIKPENRGKFTETKRRTGKTTEELTHSSNPLTRKRAIFAQNAKKWHHAFGGDLMTHGATFDTGLTLVGNGGTHEENPYEGVPMGVDAEGVPNLVEEGEVIFNDYVFSKRLKVPKAVRKKYKLGGPITFADAAIKMGRESEERPNDPISQTGLFDSMAKLMIAQEEVRNMKSSRKYAHGGNLFPGGGDLGNQTLNYNNSTQGLYFGLSPEEFNPYKADGTIDFDIMYGANSPYTKRRQYVIDHWDEPGVQEWLGRYVEGINKYNEGRENYTPMTKRDITKDIFTNRTWDKSWGGMHAGVDYAGDPERIIKTQHILKDEDGLYFMPKEAEYFSGRSVDSNYDTWEEKYKDVYERLDNGAYTTEYDPKTNTETRTYLYAPIKKKGPKNRYYKLGDDNQYGLVEGENPYLDIMNSGNYEQVKSMANDQDGTDYYYDPKKAPQQYEKLPTGLRFTPAISLGVTALTDALGWTNKPDYSDAEAVLTASRDSGIYEPVKFKPIGNYMTYNPFDRNYYVNKLSAEAAATRRALANTSGGNRATAYAGLLAADYNNQSKMGDLFRQAEEYNFTRRQIAEEFNKGIKAFNSEGLFKAAHANQEAKIKARSSYLSGALSAAQMREKARLTADQIKSANLSGLVTSFGDIGRENMAWNWRNFGLATDSFAHVGEGEHTELLGNTDKKSKARGGKIKRRKGLTI